jgi:hypothetical protein
MWYSFLREEVRTLDVQSKRLVKVLFCCILEILHWEDTGIENENIDLATLLDNFLDKSIDLGDTASIRLDGQSALDAFD